MLDLYTTQEQFENLHTIIDGSRANARSIKMDYQSVINLLMDHSAMLKELGHARVRVVKPEKTNGNG
mgnify:FL=1